MTISYKNIHNILFDLKIVNVEIYNILVHLLVRRFSCLIILDKALNALCLKSLVLLLNPINTKNRTFEWTFTSLPLNKNKKVETISYGCFQYTLDLVRDFL